MLICYRFELIRLVMISLSLSLFCSKNKTLV